MNAIRLFLTAILVLAPQVSSSLDTSSVAAKDYDAAYTAIRSQNWAEAARLLEPMTKENPYNGGFWYYLGSSYYGLERWAEGAEAYERAADLGYNRSVALYNAACCLSLGGETERAVDVLERALHGHLNAREELLRRDTDLDNIRATPAFSKRILPQVAENTSRQDGWRIDMEYLQRRMEETHFDLYRNISRDDWNGELSRIRKNVGKMDDHEIVVALMALFARIGDGHTGIALPMEGGSNIPAVHQLAPWHVIPVEFYVFDDGIFVRRAAGRYRDAVGKRVISIGRVSADEAFDRCATVTQRDNSQQILWIAPRYMRLVEVLHGLKIIDDLDGVDLVVADASGHEEKLKLEPVPFDQNSAHMDFADGVSMLEGETPMYLRNTQRHYGFEYLADEKLVYFQFNAVRNVDGAESLEDFAQRLLAFINENDVDALVIDVRLNHGGNNFLVKPIVDGLAHNEKINQRGKLFMIIGRETFSACQNFTNRMERETEVIFAGEPTASRPNFVGETNPIWLPWSGLEVRGSSRYWQDSVSEDARMWVAPELIAGVSSDDYRRGIDPAMAAIREYRMAHQEFLEEQATR